jgi:hypothetical protein
MKRKGDNAHAVNDQKFTRNVLAGSTGEKDDWASKVFGVTPATGRNAVGYLTEACWIGQKLLIPD